MQKIKHLALIGIAASSLLATAFSSTAVAAPKTTTAASTTMKGSLPNGKPFQYLNSRIDSLQAQINLLIGRVGSLEDWQARAQIVLDKLQLDTAKNAAAIALLQAQIDDIKGILATKQDIIDQACPANQHVYKLSPTEGLVCSPDVGVNGLTVLTAVVVADVPANSTADAAAVCPTGSAPTGGSFNAAPELTVNSSTITPTGYQVNVTNSTAVSLPVTVQATCLAIAK